MRSPDPAARVRRPSGLLPDYPEPPPDPALDDVVGMPQSPSAVSAGLPKLASYFVDGVHDLPDLGSSAGGMSVGTGTTTMIDGVGVTQQALTGVTLPFRVTITGVMPQPDGAFASLDVAKSTCASPPNCAAVT